MAQPRGRRRLPVAGVLGTAAAVAASLAAAPPVAATPSAGDRPQPRPAYTLTILHNNDGESQLLGVDADIDGDGAISAEEERAFGGIARFATLVDQERADATQGRARPGYAWKRVALTVSSGDNFLAGPEFTASLERGVPFYDATAMKLIGYDASAVGNHEFDFGPDVLADFIESTDGAVPFVSSNLDVSQEPRLLEQARNGSLVTRTVVKDRGTRFGVVGLTTPTLPTVTSPGQAVARPELAEIVNAQVDVLTRQGIKKVVLISHLQDIDEERALVPQLRGVDVVVGGGGGELLAKPADPLVPGDSAVDTYPLVAVDSTGAEVPVVTTSGDYKYLGRLVVHFDRHGDVVGWDEQRSGPVRVSGVGVDGVFPDRDVQREVVEPVTEFVAELDETVVATSEVPLDGVRDNVRTQETNLGNLLADALRWAAAEHGTFPPQVGVQNGGGIRNDGVIPAGDVTALDTFDVAPFTNFVALIPEVPRDTFRQLLERGVSALPEPGGQFIQISGAEFTYDLRRTAQVVDEGTGDITVPGERIRSVVLDDGTVVIEDGQVVPGDPISLATNDFSARGGDAYPLAGLDFTTFAGVTYQSALQDYLEVGLGGVVTAADYPVGGEGRIEPVAP